MTPGAGRVLGHTLPRSPWGPSLADAWLSHSSTLALGGSKSLSVEDPGLRAFVPPYRTLFHLAAFWEVVLEARLGGWVGGGR